MILDIPFLSGKSANEVKTSSPMIPMSHLKMWNSACACLWLPVLAVPPPLSVAHETGFTSFQGGSYIHSSGKFGAPLNPPKAGPLILHLSSKWLLFVDFKHVQACAGRKRCERMWKNHHFKFQPISMNSARGNKLSTPVARPSRMGCDGQACPPQIIAQDNKTPTELLVTFWDMQDLERQAMHTGQLATKMKISGASMLHVSALSLGY